MSADLKVGLLSTIYATWLHNNLAIALFLGIVLAVVNLVIKPRRKFVFLLIGFILLLLQFEYQKHFAAALEQQTVNSIILQGEHVRAKSFLEDFFQKLIPFGMWIAGWGMVFLGMVV
jgi:hypothetical protein